MRRLLAAIVWTAVAALGVAAWRWSPGGFPLLHPRMLTSVVIPFVFFASGAWGLIQVARNERTQAVALATGALLLGFAAALPMLFGRAGAPMALAAAPFALAFVLPARELLRRAPRAGTVVAAGMLLLGAGAAVAMRAPEPSTRPLGPPMQTGEGADPRVPVVTRCGRLQLTIDPVLQLEQVSSNRFWSIFGTDDANAAVGPAHLATEMTDGVLHLDATRTLGAAVFSHLNSFARLRISGTNALRLRFGDAAPVEVRPVDYPEGRPMRFASWDGARLRVYEATSAEKGPFRELAQTKVSRTDALTIDLLDGDAVQCRVTFHDFTTQASTGLSPTAGYGIPQNAIEFAAADGAPLQQLIVSLAATSVGRGWDTVGHAPGTYRNRITVDRQAE